MTDRMPDHLVAQLVALELCVRQLVIDMALQQNRPIESAKAFFDRISAERVADGAPAAEGVQLHRLVGEHLHILATTVRDRVMMKTHDKF